MRRFSAVLVSHFGFCSGYLPVSTFPVFRRFQKGGVAVGTDVFQRLLVFAAFVAGVFEEGLHGLSGLVLPAVPRR